MMQRSSNPSRTGRASAARAVDQQEQQGRQSHSPPFAAEHVVSSSSSMSQRQQQPAIRRFPSIRQSEEEAEHAALVNEILAGSGYSQQERMRNMNQAMEQNNAMLALHQQQQQQSSSSVYPPQSQQSSPMLQLATQHMQGALLMLPQEKQQAYREALEKSPQVVHIDTPLEQYLVAYSFDYFKAAERLCDYWTERRAVFGAAPFHRPLRLTNTPPHGTALSPDARAVLQSGFFSIPAPDAHGRPVVLCDRQLVPGPFQKVPVRRQVIFYVQHVATRQQWNGNGSGTTTPQPQHSSTTPPPPLQGFLGLTAGESMPNQARRLSPSTLVVRIMMADYWGGGRLIRMHCIIPKQQPQSAQRLDQQQEQPEEPPLQQLTSENDYDEIDTPTEEADDDNNNNNTSNFPYSLSEIFEGFLEQWSQWRSFHLRLCFHKVRSEQDCLAQVQAHGLGPQHLPPRLGGTANFAAWWERQLVWEQERYRDLCHDDESGANKRDQEEEKKKTSDGDDKKKPSSDGGTATDDDKPAKAAAQPKSIHSAIALLFEQWQSKQKPHGKKNSSKGNISGKLPQLSQKQEANDKKEAKKRSTTTSEQSPQDEREKEEEAQRQLRKKLLRRL